jgi:class 3 adenylate cyclase/tetratricopeptide (TPR) repeat protein
MKCASCSHDNPADARFCSQCGTRLEKTSPEAERRPLTVVFCDIVGSTALSSTMDVEDWHGVVVAYQEAVNRGIAGERGHVAQYLGDGVLAYFGYPQAAEDDAVRAVRAALAITSAIDTLNSDLERRFGVRVAVRIGIHSGSVVIGSVGAGSTSTDLAFGEAVNLAARLESIAPDNGIVISAATKILLNDTFELTSFGSHSLKGIQEPVETYQAGGESGGRSRRATGELLGREPELEQLSSLWRECRSGGAQVAWVEGAPGLGKSHLIDAFVEKELGPTDVVRFECRSEHAPESLHPVIAGLRARLATNDVTGLHAHLTGLALDADATTALLAPLFDFQIPEHLSAPQRAPAAQRIDSLKALRDWTLKEAEQNGQLLIVEDLHWADEATADWLRDMAAEPQGARALLLISSREPMTGYGGSSIHSIKLQPLDQGTVEELVRAVCGTQLDDEVVRQLVERADGIPLFAGELARSTLSSDANVIPATLQTVLAARLDQLGEARALAQVAAVLGREFDYDLLEKVAGDEVPGLDRMLGFLAAREILICVERDPLSYAFSHALVHEAAYDSLVKNRRRSLHGRIAEVMRLSKDFSNVVLAQHCELGERFDWAVEAWQHAVADAERRGAMWDSRRYLEHLDTLVARAGDEEAQANMRLNIALQKINALRNTEGFGRGLKEVLDSALKLTEQISDFRRGFVLLGFVTYHTFVGEHRACIEYAREALEIARESGVTAMEVLAEISLAQSLMALADYEEAAAHAERAATIYRPEHFFGLGAGIPRADVLAHAYHGLALCHLGEVRKAYERIEAALALSREGDPHPPTLGTALHIAARVYVLSRDFDRAYAAVREGQRAVADFGDEHTNAMLRIQAACIDADAGRPGAADTLRELLTGYRDQGGEAAIALYTSHLAQGYLLEERPAEARALLEQTLSMEGIQDERSAISELHRLLGEALQAEHPGSDDARQEFRHAAALAREQRARLFELRALTGALSSGDRGTIERITELLGEYGPDEEAFDVASARSAVGRPV